MIRILSLYGPKPRLGGGEHHARVVAAGLGKGRGKLTGEKPAFVILLHLGVYAQHRLYALAGSFQYGRNGGADDVASRFCVSRVPVGPKARQTRVRKIEHDTDHAWMEVISTFV